MQHNPMEKTETAIRQIITNVTTLTHDVPGDADLYLDLGVASVHALELLTGLEEAFGVAVPDDEFVEATSINKLTAMMRGLMNQAEGESVSA
jgi:acyl carrier protein